jgi:hypothetical protein
MEKEAAAMHKTKSYTKKLYTLFSDFVLPYKNKAYLCVLFLKCIPAELTIKSCNALKNNRLRIKESVSTP